MANQATNNNIDAVLAEYMRRKDAGEEIDHAEFIAAHPPAADDLREYFASVEEIERLAGPPLASTVNNSIKAAETHVSSHGDSVSAKSPQQTHSANASKDNSLPETFGRYRIEKQLGRGAMGAVYLAHDTQLDRRVALKTPTFDTTADPDMVERFYREARAAANLRHAGICPIFDVGEIDGTHYISMAYIAGKPLADLIDVDKKLPIRSVASLVRKIALALDHAHSQGVIHRDLKPANIMIDKQKQPLIMDFGLARRVDKDEQTRLTQDGTILGTPAYMSPEQVEGNLESGKQSDVYSLGVILYELLTGDVPFQGTIAAVIGQIMTQDAPPPSQDRPDVDAALDAICRKMMARKLEDRYASMKEAAEALTEYLRSGGAKASRGRQPEGAHPEADASGSPTTATEDKDLTAFLADSPVDDSSLTPPQHSGTIVPLLKPWKQLPPRTKTIATSVLAGVLLVMMGVVLLIRTDKGWVKIEILDPTLTVSVDKKTITADNDGKQLELDVGPHELLVKYEGLELPFEESFEIKKNDTVALRVTRLGENIVVLREGDELEKPKETKSHDSTSPTGFTWEDLTAFSAAKEGFSENVLQENIYVNGERVIGTKEMPHPQRMRLLGLTENNKWIFASSFESPAPGTAERPSEILYQFDKPVVGLRMTAVCANRERNATGRLKVYADRKLVDERDITTKSATIEIRIDSAKTLSLQTTATSNVGGHRILYLNPEVLVSTDESPTGRSLTPTEILTSPDWEWAEPEAIVEVNSEENESAVTVSGDGLQMLFSRGEAIFGSDRDSTTAPWGQPKKLKWPQGYKLPSLSGDGCTAVVGASGSNLAIMTRPSRDAPWGAPVKLGKQINTSYHQSYPSLSDDGLTLIYSLHWPRGAPDGKPRADLRVSRRESLDLPWSEPEDLGPLINTPGAQKTSCLSSDGRVLLFAQQWKGGWATDYFMATRDSLTAAWNRPVRLPNIFQTNGDDNSIDLSSGGREVYISQGGDIYVIRRVPKASVTPPTTGDSVADSWQDLVSLIETKSDVLSGKFESLDEGFRLERDGSNKFAKVRFPVTPNGHYRLRLEVTPVQPSELSIVLPVQLNRVALRLTDNKVNLQAIDNQVHAKVPAEAQAKCSLRVNRRYQVAVEVRPFDDQVQIVVEIDGKELLNWTGSQDRISLGEVWPDKSPGLIAWSRQQTIYDVHSCELQVLDGEAKPTVAVAPFNAEQAKAHQQTWAEHLGLPVEKEVELPDGAKMTFMLIPPGEFLMGSGKEEQTLFQKESAATGKTWAVKRIASEGPPHRVRIRQPFYLAKFETTQQQWEAVMGTEPDKFTGKPPMPVQQSDWNAIPPLLKKLNESGRPYGMQFILPTEAQWEYACRAGTTTYWHCGDDTVELRKYAWFSANSRRRVQPVGRLLPNPFGLFDMHGNAWEWCADWYTSDYYATSPVEDPAGPSKAGDHVRRGGSRAQEAGHSRSAHRRDISSRNNDSIGFRLAMTIDAAKLEIKPPDVAVTGRSLFTHPGGYFIQGRGQDWFQKWDEGKKPPNLFREMQRTAEFVELRHRLVPVTFRLYSDRSDIKDERKGSTTFTKRNDGQWVTPAKVTDRDRRTWVQPHGYFLRGRDTDWFETWDDGKKEPNLFEEVQRTDDFVELKHRHLQVSFRLYADRAMGKSARRKEDDFVLRYNGAWQGLKPPGSIISPPIPNPITPTDPPGVSGNWIDLFNGKDLTGWQQMQTSGRQDDIHRPSTGDWVVQERQIVCNSSRSGWLKSAKQFDNFELELEFKLSQLGNSGVYIRSSGSGRLSRTGVEAQVIDDTAAKFKLTSKNRSGAIHNVTGPSTSALNAIGQWNKMSIRCEGDLIQITLNDVVTAQRNMANDSVLRSRPRSGYLGLANWHGEGKGTAFRNIRIRELEKSATTGGPGPAKPNTRIEQQLKKLEETIFPWLVWVQAKDDKRKPIAVATKTGLCCVYPGGFKDVEISSLDETQKAAGTVGSRRPSPFCWIDPAKPKAIGIALARPGAHRIAQPGVIVMRKNGKPELQVGQVNADGTFTPEKPYNPPNRGVAAPGPIFNANGECLGYGVRSKRGSPIKIYPLRRE